MPDGAMTPLFDRRNFLKAGAAVGGGLVLSLALPMLPRRAWAAAENPRMTPDAIRETVRAGGSEFTRTKWTAAEQKSRKRGIGRTWAWRSAKTRLQNGYSLIVSLMTRDVAQK